MSGMQSIELTSEHAMLQDSANRYLGEAYGFDQRARSIASPEGFDARQWRSFAEMGWLALPFPGSVGGADGTPLDLMLLMQSFGRALVVEPYFSTVVLGGLAVLASGSDEQQQRLLVPLIAGELEIAVGLTEPQSGYDNHDVTLVAEPRGDGFVLTGRKAVVLGAASADLLIVSARTSGARRERDGITLFIVKRQAPGMQLRTYQTIDGRRAADVSLDGVEVSTRDVLGAVGGAAGVIDRITTMGNIALLGEAVGCLEGALAQTAEYLNTRQQFGQKLASFQALRHRVADMFVVKEEARALSLLAAQSVVAGGSEAALAVSAAKAYVGEAGRKLCEDAVQLHGAIAIADEYIVGHYLKRLIAVDRMFGDASHHLDAYLAARGAFEGEAS